MSEAHGAHPPAKAPLVPELTTEQQFLLLSLTAFSVPAEFLECSAVSMSATAQPRMQSGMPRSELLPPGIPTSKALPLASRILTLHIARLHLTLELLLARLIKQHATPPVIIAPLMNRLLRLNATPFLVLPPVDLIKA